MNIDETIVLLEKLEKREAREHGDDIVWFRILLRHFMKVNHLTEENMLEVSVKLLKTNKLKMMRMGLAIIEEMEKTTKEIEAMLVDLFKRVDFSSQLFGELRWLIWKYEIKEALPFVISRYHEVKKDESKKLKNKDFMLSALARCVYKIDQKTGAMKRDYVKDAAAILGGEININETIILLEKLAKKKTRKRGIFDDEWFRLSLEDFMKANYLTEENMLEVSVKLLKKNKLSMMRMGLAIIEEMGKTTKETNAILVNLFKRIGFSSQLFDKVRWLIWKYKIKEALPFVISRYHELKKNKSKRIKYKDSMLSSLARSAYKIDQKTGANIILDVIKWDYVKGTAAASSYTAFFFDIILMDNKLSVLDQVLKKINQEDDKIKKYVLEECIKGLHRSNYTEEKRKEVVDYVRQRLGF